jgi:hypothetical protein
MSESMKKTISPPKKSYICLRNMFYKDPQQFYSIMGEEAVNKLNNDYSYVWSYVDENELQEAKFICYCLYIIKRHPKDLKIMLSTC